MLQSEVSFNNGSPWYSRRAVFILMKLSALLSPVGFRDLVAREGSAADLGGSWLEESYDHLGWKRPLGSLRPNVNPALPSPPLNHGPKRHVYTSFQYPEGWGLPHCPGQPGPTPDHSLSKEISPISNLNPP